MLRILLALVVITILFYMNPLTKMNSNHVDEKNQTKVEQQVDEVQNQVDYAKQMLQKEFEQVDKD